jgi:large repetitive protein
MGRVMWIFGYYSPYAAYADVTALVSSLADPNGEYTVANILASNGGGISGGISGGWTLVVVYENPSLAASRFITTFDGYAGIQSGQSVDIPVSGFTTLPAPFSVNARMGVAALEGDNRIGGDGLAIDAFGGGVFTPLSNTLNPANNFFNSNITRYDALVTDRNPNSVNTLGWDVDLFEINNQFNSVIPNDATNAVLRATSSQDKYDIFFTSFDVEIIEPNIVLEKRVNTPGGVDITGQGVNLGQVLDYVLTFRNIGNDDATNYTIRDILPLNVSPPDGRSDFIASDFTLPPGVTYVYTPATREVIFTIPDNLVEENDPVYTIRFRVQVAENCFDFIDACSDLIQNLAYSTYQGVENSAIITDDPSVTDFNACGFIVPGATNFLLDDLSDCNFQRTVELCGSFALLNAGDGFDEYVWVRDANGNGEIDPSDPIITDGDPDNDPSTMMVTQPGTYIVDKIVADPCKGFKEIITVTPYGAGLLPNPIIEFMNAVNGDTDPFNDIAGEIVQCSVDNDLLPKLFLCGAADTKQLQVNIVDAQTIIWEQLNEGSCSPSGDDCANKALTCTWNQVGTGGNYIVSNEGQYRLSVTYQNGCTSRFYFNVFQNNLDIQYTREDIICNNPGNITISNLGTGYGFQLVNAETNSILVPFSANNGPSFDFNTGGNGTYIVEVTQLDGNGVPIDNACIFRTPEIGILDRDVTYAVTGTDATCTTMGSINIQVNNAAPNYTYELRLDDGSNGGLGTLIDDETAQPDNNFTFTGLNAGNYIVVATTADGCSHTEQVTITDTNDLQLEARVSQHITCREGNILMSSTGGQTPHTYAIWSYVDESGTTVLSYPTPQDIPASEFQGSQIFDILDPGDYTFVVVDRNNCFAFSNTVSIEFRPAADFDPTSIIDVSCFGEASGTIQFNLIDDNGYQLTFVLFDQNGVQLATNTTGLFPNLPAGDYEIIINQRRGSASCDYTENYTIATPANALTGTSVMVQDYTCIHEAIIEVQNVLGGTAPYSYSIDGVNFVPDTTPNAHRFENLTNGTYTPTIRDAAGCLFPTDPIVINDLNEPTDLTFATTIPNCPILTADVTVSVVNGNPAFAYEIIAPLGSTVNNGANNVFIGLAPGTYTFRVTDDKGCSFTEDYTIAPVQRISVTGILNGNVSCLGAADGSATFIIDNFLNSYDYIVTGPTTFSGTAQSNATLPLSGLGAGTYTITVTDNDTNCSDTAVVVVEQPSAALALGINETQPSCTDTGSVLLSATGGWGGYSFTLTNPDTTPVGTNTTGSFTGLTQTGTFTATVTDVNGCVATDTFTLNAAIAPVLAIVPNDLCYDAVVGLTLTANVTSGGDGNFEYSLNGGAFATTNVFSGLAPGTYTIRVRDGNNCTDDETITVDPELSVIASAGNISACAPDTDIDITAAGGDGNYVYAVVLDGAIPSSGDFVTTNPVTVTTPGDYDVYVRDNNGAAGYCEATHDITVIQDSPLALSVSNTPILCSGENQATITINATGGESPYTYSIDGGITFVPQNTFPNRGPGNYAIRVRDANNCEISQPYAITEPFTLSASAAVTQLVECNPTDGAEVRITNAQGGTAPYSYSFDGGLTYGTNPIGFLLPGSHTLYIRDANGCDFPMSLTINAAPTPPNVVLTPSVDYGCDGTGVVTITPDNPSLDYTYALNGALNTPADSNVFTGVPVGTHTVTVDYIDSTPPAPSNLLLESFGSGANTSITQIDPAYCYEPQDGTVRACDPGVPVRINDGEYSVTQVIASPFGSWRSPNDHTGNANGRFLAINVGGVAGVGGIIYAKRDIEVIPNRDITVSLWAYNLQRVGTSGGDPTIEIQLVDGLGTVIASTATGNVPKNNNADDWHNYSVALNPGANTNLDIVIRTNSAVVSGNDIAIDDIEAFQIPEQCSQTVTMDVIVEPGNAFGAQITGFQEATCVGSNNGSITFDVENFGTAGFEYQVNGGGFSAALLSGPVTIPALAAGNYTIEVRDVNDTSCSIVLTQTITEPTPVVATAIITQQASCTDGGSITASASGGTPNYVYQLEDTLGGIIAGFDFASNGNNTLFTGLVPGDYLVRARDVNGCGDIIDAPLTINPTDPIVFTAEPTTCYSGTNDGEIVVNVTSGNGGYQFSINGGPWLAPTPTTATSYTFANLSAGSYDIEVRDALGCPLAANTQTVVINPQLTANAALTNDITCLVDASVTITANGGSGTYAYEWSSDGGTSYASTNFVGNVFTTNSFGTFVFRVTDTSSPTACTIVTNSVTITEAETPVIANVVPTDILCNGESTGSLDVQIDTSVGLPPFVINVVETTGPTNYGTQTSGLPAGSYEVTITDDKGCVSAPFPVSISEPAPIFYTTTDVPITCNSGTGTTNPGEISITGVAGGTAEYTYILTGNNGIAPQTYTTTPLARDHTFTVLEFGIYQIDVVDANGCASFTTEIIASPPDYLDIDVSTATADCLVGGTAIISVGAAVGSGNYEFAVLESYLPPYSSTYQPADVPGGDTTTFTGLTPGITYTFVVFDMTTNCYYFEEAAAPVNTPSNMVATLDAVNNVTCTGAADGNISFTFSGFDVAATDVNYEIFNRQSNVTTGHSGSASVNPPVAVSVPNFATLPPGEYYLLLTEVGGPNNGCSVDGGTFTIRESVNALGLDVASPQNDNCNPNAGVITAVGRFGTAPYEYQYLPNTAPAPLAGDAGWVGNTSANVEAGDYIVYVKDAYGCIFQRPITVLEDPSPLISLAIVDECVDEGMFQVTVTLDNPLAASAPFQIRVNGSAYQNFVFDGSNQYVVTGLSSGLAQTIEVRDLNGCSAMENFSIQPPLQFNATLTTLLDCEVAPANNAEITIDVTVGSGAYEYEIDGPGAVDQARTAMGGTSITWAGASVDGSYTVTVYDTSTAVPNCLGSMVVNVPPAVTPNLGVSAFTDVTCHGADDGSITVTSTDVGTGPYTYEIISGPGSSAVFPLAPTTSTALRATFDGLQGLVAPGITYTIRVTAANGCFTDITQVILQPEPITNVNATVTEFACTVGNNGDNATITIDGAGITGGSGTYVRYEFIEEDDPNTVAVEPAVVVQMGTNPVYMETDTAGGSYTINVYDSNGCVGTTTALIAPFDQLLSAAVAITNTVTCTPGNDGELTMNVVSSLGDPTRFEYSIDNGISYQSSPIFGGLAAGAYTLMARHLDTGCIISATQNLLEPNTFTINVVKTSDVVCFGTATGAVNFELVDATYPGGFTWTIYDTNGTLANTLDDTVVVSNTEPTNGPTADVNLPAGSYYVSVSQDNNPFCINTEAFTIAGPPADISGAVQIQEITCVGNDGAIDIINVTGGWGGYTYYVGTTPPAAPTDYTALPRFENLPVGTYEAWVRDAQGCERMIQNNMVLADPAPITANLQVNQENCINLQGEIEVVNVLGGQGANYTYQLIRNGSNFRAPQNTRIFSGLGAGSYEVAITDQWGCTFTTAAELLYEEMNLMTTVIKEMDCTVNPGGEITVTVSGSSTNLEFEMTTPLGSVVSQTSGSFTNLTEVGTYTFVVRDLDTTNPVCEKTITQTLNAPVAPVLLASTVTDVSCFGGNDGSIRANLDPVTNVDPVYQYELYAMSNLVTPLAGPQNSPLFENLLAGDYRVRVISNKSCDTFRDETITEPTELLVSASATAFDCAPDNSTNNAVITVTVLDGATTPGIPSGTSPYLYSIDGINYQTTNTFTVLDTGVDQTITVYVTDGEGCPASDTVTIAALNTFTASVAQDVVITCQNDERVTVSVTETAAPGDIYSIELLPVPNSNGTLVSSTNTSATFDLNSVGNYTFRVTNTTTNCYVDTAPYAIAPFDLIRASAIAVDPATCFGDNNGSLDLTLTGYVGTFDYEVFAQGGASVLTGGGNATSDPFTLNIAGLSGGNYYVNVVETDPASTLCNARTNTVTILSPDMALTATVNVLSQPTCTNDQGAMGIAIAGGYAPYDIAMTNTTTGQLYTANNVQGILFDGLSAGTFDIVVTDNGGCVVLETRVLDPALPIVANATPLITDLACFGDRGATVSGVVISGGSGTYEYQLNYYDATGTNIVASTAAQLSPNFNDLGAGIYSITVSDGWNCDVETNTVEVREPTRVQAQLLRTDPLTCATGVEFELFATGGSGTYEYSVDNITYLPISSNPMPLPETGTLGAGTYQYFVRDAINGCEAVLSNAITEDVIDPLTLLVDPSAAFINCNGESTAAIFAEAFGGLGIYRFSLYSDASLTAASLLEGPQAIGTFRNLPAGTYYVYVTSADCTAPVEEVVITEPEPLAYTEDIMDVTCAGESDGRITVTLAGGAGGYQYAISPNLSQFDTVNTFTDLAPGDYTIIAQDQNGCFEYLTYSIVEPTIMEVNATATPEICVDSADGSISLNINGGTAPYRTAINANQEADFVVDRTSFTDLAAGNYLIFVRDANGCETNVIVDVVPGVDLNATVTPVYECTGTVPENYVNITLQDETVLGDVMYALDSMDPTALQLNPDFRNIAPGQHFITIAHANGCMITVDFIIAAFEPLTLVLEQRNLNEITALGAGGRAGYTYYFNGVDNGDDNTFYINRTDTYEVRVVDENGCEAMANIFMEFIDIEIPNFFTPDGDGQNDFWMPRNIQQFPGILIKIFDRYGRVVSELAPGGEGWDGKYSGRELPTGDYWYVIQLNGESDEREFVGHFTLYR